MQCRVLLGLADALLRQPHVGSCKVALGQRGIDLAVVSRLAPTDVRQRLGRFRKLLLGPYLTALGLAHVDRRLALRRRSGRQRFLEPQRTRRTDCQLLTKPVLGRDLRPTLS
jgi:hypothetical protein